MVGLEVLEEYKQKGKQANFFLTERFSGINSNIQKIDSAFKRFTNQNSDLANPGLEIRCSVGNLQKNQKGNFPDTHCCTNTPDA